MKKGNLPFKLELVVLADDAPTPTPAWAAPPKLCSDPLVMAATTPL